MGAEPEAEADPALLYTTSAVHTPVTSVNNVPVVQAAVKTVAHTPVVYNAAVHTPVVKAVAHTPVVYNTAVHTPLVYNTLPLTHSVYNTVPVVNSVVPAATTTVTKREAEAEADPALVYTTGLTTP